MKALKIIGIVIAVLIAIVVVLGLVLPKDYAVSRSVQVNAPTGTVYKAISTFAAFDKWNPWNKYDTTQVVTVEGTDGTIGAKRSWKGNKDVGSGSMTVTNVIADKQVDYDLAFMEPYESHSQVSMAMEPAEGGQKVTWSMKGKMDFPFNVMGLFMSMDKMIGKDFEEGLANLKNLCEAQPATGYEVAEVDWAEKNIATVRKVVKFQDIGPFFEASMPKLYEAVTKAGAKPGIPVGIYYRYDEAAGETDMAAGVPFEGKADLGKDVTLTNVPAGKAYMIDYYGAYEKMQAPYAAMGEFLKTKFNRENPDLVVEEYITDPMNEKDTAKWNTKIYFFVNNTTAAN